MQSHVSSIKMKLSLCSFNVRDLGKKIKRAQFLPTFILNNSMSVFYKKRIQQKMLKQPGVQIAHLISISLVEAVDHSYLASLNADRQIKNFSKISF